MTCHTPEKNAPSDVGRISGVWSIAQEPPVRGSTIRPMKAKGGKWTFDELEKFLTRPQGYIPGTKMTSTGIENSDQRADLIVYLRTQSDNPMPPPPAPPASAGNAQSVRRQRRVARPRIRHSQTRAARRIRRNKIRRRTAKAAANGRQPHID